MPMQFPSYPIDGASDAGTTVGLRPPFMPTPDAAPIG